MSYPAWKNPPVLPLSWSLHRGQRTRVGGVVCEVLGVRKSTHAAKELVKSLKASTGDASIGYTCVSAARYCYGIVIRPVVPTTTPTRQAVPV